MLETASLRCKHRHHKKKRKPPPCHAIVMHTTSMDARWQPCVCPALSDWCAFAVTGCPPRLHNGAKRLRVIAQAQPRPVSGTVRICRRRLSQAVDGPAGQRRSPRGPRAFGAWATRRSALKLQWTWRRALLPECTGPAARSAAHVISPCREYRKVCVSPPLPRLTTPPPRI